MQLLASISVSSAISVPISSKLSSIPNIEAIIATTGIHSISAFNTDTSIVDLYAYLYSVVQSFELPLPTHILVCTQTPDMLMPVGSCLLLERFPFLASAQTFDIANGCTGFNDLFALAHSLTLSKPSSIVYCFTGDISSRHVDSDEHQISSVFGDLVNLSVFNSRPHFEHLSEFVNVPKFTYSISRNLNGCLSMEGIKVLSFVLQDVIPSLLDFISKLPPDINHSDVTLVLHQANQFIVDKINRAVHGRFPDIITKPFCMQSIGNSSSSTIPFALATSISESPHIGTKLFLLCGFGVGTRIHMNLLSITSPDPILFSSLSI